MTDSGAPDDKHPAEPVPPPAEPGDTASADPDFDDAGHDLDDPDGDDDPDGVDGEDDAPEVSQAPGRFRGGALVAALAVGVVLGLIAGAAPGLLRHSARSSAAPKPSSSTAPSVAPSAGTCTWYDRAESTVKVGRPATDVPHSGLATLTIVTDAGTIVVAMDAGRTPCAIAAVAHLASHGYYPHDTCDRGPTSLQCGSRRPDFAWAHEDSARYPRVLVSQSYQVTLPCAGPKDLCDKVTGPPTTVTSVSEDAVVPRGAVLLTAAAGNGGAIGGTGFTFRAGGLGDGIDNGSFVICLRETRLPAESTPLGTVTSGLDILDRWVGGHTGQLVSVSVTYG